MSPPPLPVLSHDCAKTSQQTTASKGRIRVHSCLFCKRSRLVWCARSVVLRQSWVVVTEAKGPANPKPFLSRSLQEIPFTTQVFTGNYDSPVAGIPRFPCSYGKMERAGFLTDHLALSHLGLPTSSYLDMWGSKLTFEGFLKLFVVAAAP